ncbi:Maf family protein [Nocardioides mesophilus]|uniref:Nucleoside triphosphate pyrophosphatase n=1 Tax=Nocardioides mesophilus TaxID=433659 RepID=A0A7G9RDJ5_9ACTN|nr:nucleoside triphosphate pyrophosphatase [Nocardioides mesophilus]QNN53670.1 septum formation inhibitor Maf [Nocardioides mesophilus]
MTGPTRLVLASASPARLSTLRNAGLDPEVLVSGVDESVVESTDPATLATRLAELKADAVLGRLDEAAAGAVAADVLVLGCDSVLDFGGEVLGKPADAEEARARWQKMRGGTGVLHTGHCLVLRSSGRRLVRAVDTVVHFAEVDDVEIDAYVASGEPLHVAGAFTLDGLGGAFVRGIEGDPHNVVGVSLPALREMVAELGLRWTDLWSADAAAR